MKNERGQEVCSAGANAKAESAFYEIQVLGKLDRAWSKWFERMSLTHIKNGGSGAAYTLISGPVIDQSALHGLLTKIQNLNLTLVSVHRISPGKNAFWDVPDAKNFLKSR